MIGSNKIFRNATVFLFALMLCLASAGESLAGESLRDIEGIKQRGKITIAMYWEDAPPFFMKDSKGKFMGFDVELARLIGQKLGVEVSFYRKPKTFDEVVQAVAEKKSDIAVSMLSRTLDRAMHVRFTEPYVKLSQGILINRLQAAKLKIENSRQIETMNREGIKIGVEAGTSYLEFARDLFPKATIVSYGDLDKLVDDILENKILAGYFDEIVIKTWLHENKEGNLYIKALILKDKFDDISIAVNKNNIHLLSWLNLLIENMEADKALDRLRGKYLESESWRE